MNVPEGVVVEEQWAVRAEDGEIYRVQGDRHDVAAEEARLLRLGAHGDGPEPNAVAARRYVMSTPDGMVSTGWRWTL